MFDKKTYTERRKQGLRGQDDAVTTKVIAQDSGRQLVRLGNKSVFVNRKTSRRKQPSDPATTKKTGKASSHKVGEPKFKLEIDPLFSNNTRMRMRQQARLNARA